MKTTMDPKEAFDQEVIRVKNSMEGGFMSPEMASFVLSHFGRAVNQINDTIDYEAVCKEINPDYDQMMARYRSSDRIVFKRSK